MKKLKINFTFFEAFDGHSFSEDELKKHVKPNHGYLREFTPGEVGCFLSHYSVLKKIVDKQIPYALVLEDDVELSPRFPTLLNQVETEIKQGDVICFYVSVPEPCRFYKEDQIDKDYFYIRPFQEELVVGAAAYLVTNDAAQKLVQNIVPMDNVIDDWRAWIRKKFIKDFKIVFPHPVDLSDVYSDINEPFGDLKLRLKKIILHYEVPFLSTYILNRRKRKRFEDRFNKIIINDEKPDKLFL
ncbi:hypothetical protein AAE02nite_08770 [Adhaeribacter aerolatus]|uniref:Glycosyl transferase family 25 domain-containing protein n=2 Tax=Adhaeribacter aerolatus TaxID=670289 RepID=A0A512AU52_9BACT|nr:hypothetical protein AAE02nite_08770 [Adhaeribacter aerolatus]